MITIDQLTKIMPLAKARASLFLDPLNATMTEFFINTPARQASFLAQVAHESGQLRYVRELASGEAYEGRKDLGNTEKGDGVRFKGRGLIQLTGRVNYISLMLALDIDCLNHPEIVEDPINACRSAGWYWKTRGLNELADAGNQVAITKRVNGGLTGLNERLAYFEIARKILTNV